MATVLFGCKNEEKKEISSEEQIEKTEFVTEIPVDSHSSENALDWAGIYEGTIPCVDCKGVKTVLELNNDKTFTLSQTYLAKIDGESKVSQTGNFVWDKDGNLIRLRTESGAFQYKVGENQLWMLDKKRNIIEGDLAEMYILKKITK